MNLYTHEHAWNRGAGEEEGKEEGEREMKLPMNTKCLISYDLKWDLSFLKACGCLLSKIHFCSAIGWILGGPQGCLS